MKNDNIEMSNCTINKSDFIKSRFKQKQKQTFFIKILVYFYAFFEHLVSNLNTIIEPKRTKINKFYYYLPLIIICPPPITAMTY